MPFSCTEKAFAKINLNLEVIGRRPDGYHELVSLVAFAHDLFDVVTLRRADCLSVNISGVSAHNIDGKNLILSAAEQAAELPFIIYTGHIELVKTLPVAAGLGGGSSDAAATLRAIGRLNNVVDFETAFSGLCPKLGADVPVCLQSETAQGAFMWGIGEHVWRPEPSSDPILPCGLSAVLANPRLPVATGDIFRALAAKPLENPELRLFEPQTFKNSDELFHFLKGSRNDLERPACSVLPVIKDVLSALAALPHCRLARMSGSGATCFALFENFSQAEAAASELTAEEPGWWVAKTRLS